MSRRRSSIAALLLLCAGCASGPRPSLYVLSAPAGGPAETVSGSGQTRLQLPPILLPDYLDTTDVLLRSGTNELKVSRTARWAERLSKGMTGTLSEALTARLPRDSIVLGQGIDGSARRILVDVSACDVWPDGRCVLKASWTILEKGTQKVAVAGRGTFEIPAAKPGKVDDATLVAAVARAVGELADRLAAILGTST
jgi:uncharacterized lipoprotein YmbA